MRTNIIKITLAVIVSGILSVSTTSADEMKQYIPGFYTEWEQSPESGDIGGIELFVFNSYHSPYVVYTLAEGEPGSPVLVKATIEGDKIRFKVDNRTYTGQFTPEGLKLTNDGFERLLRRGSLINGNSTTEEPSGC